MNRLREFWAFARRQPVGAACVVALALMVLIAVFANFVAPYPPTETHIMDRLSRPLATGYLLGTDEYGRDTLSRVLFGARTTLVIALSAVLVSTVVGTIWAGLSGYFKGTFDMLTQRVVDTLLAFPALLLALALAAVLGPSVPTVIIAIAVPYTPRVVRAARSSALSVAEMDYVLAARSIGSPAWYIIVRHILPNIFAPVLIIASAQLGGAVLVEASLSFLGLGVPPPAPSWGRELSESSRYWIVSPWLAVWPGVAISLLVLAANLLGDALRDDWDPRLKRV